MDFPAELESIFALAGSRERRQALRGMALAALERADFDRLELELRARQLLPLIGTRAIETAPELVPESFNAAVDLGVTSARAQGMALEHVARQIVETLGDRDIRAMPLKGPHLAAEAHGDIGLREAIDVDVLVSPEDLDGAVDVLVASGFERPHDVRRRDGLPDLHFGLGHPDLPRVEVHWRVHWYERDFSRDMLRRARSHGGVLGPAPEDLATSLLLFYARDGLLGVRLAADIAAWWDRQSDALPDAFLEEHVRAYPALAPALTAAAIAAEQVVGVPALRWLGSSAKPGHRVAMATRLMDWTQAGDLDQLHANVSLVGGLLGPPGSGRDFARRELFPADVAVSERAAHSAKRLARYALALWRVRGTRPWVKLPAVP